MTSSLPPFDKRVGLIDPRLHWKFTHKSHYHSTGGFLLSKMRAQPVLSSSGGRSFHPMSSWIVWYPHLEISLGQLSVQGPGWLVWLLWHTIAAFFAREFDGCLAQPEPRNSFQNLRGLLICWNRPETVWVLASLYVKTCVDYRCNQHTAPASHFSFQCAIKGSKICVASLNRNKAINIFERRHTSSTTC